MIADVLGVGFGPANLALATAVDEYNALQLPADRLNQRYFELQSRFGWHRGMLLDGATMQVPFIKDVATMRNPTSQYGYLAYLHSNGRLADFVNQKSFYPTRVEFHDYLEWVAAKLDHHVTYGSRVIGMRAANRAVEVKVLQSGDSRAVYPARNVVVAAGLIPEVPIGVILGPRVWHSSQFLDRIESLTEEPQRFVVVGSGQSAAEITDHVHRRFRNAQVFAVFRRYGYSVADDTPFANRIFDPDTVNIFHSARDSAKQMLLDMHRNTNYSVVNRELIQELYRRAYDERVRGEQRLRILNGTSVRGVQDGDAGRLRVELEYLLTGDAGVIDADLIVYATGYRPADPAAVLGELGKYCERDDHGRFRVTRDHRLVTTGEVAANIYIQGSAEHTHGLSSTLLSTTAVRAGEIVQSITERTSVVAAQRNEK